MIGAVILAAGPSARLGHPKQLVRYNGQTLLQRTIKAVQSMDAAVVVLGANAHLIQSTIQVPVVINSNWELGMGSSIRCGVRFLIDRHPDLTGILISVCDQPHLTSEHIDNLAKAFKSTRNITASGYADQAGVPAIFPKEKFEELSNLQDSSGAKRLIQNGKVSIVPFPGGEVDVDTPEDLDSL